MLKRRTFLQQSGLALLALGVSEVALSLTGDKSLAVPLLDRYYQALAQPNSRKLALLVGINQYSRSIETRNVASLQGCVTDVQLQRELLIHRFGFKSSDILTLTDKEATRQNIETAFVEHLTKQAAAGDVVVFHFSGYGSRVGGIQNESEDSLIQNPQSKIQNSLVPVDGVLLTKGTNVVNNLLEDTLVLLLRSLATDRVTTILDTSYTDPGTVLQGNLRIRSRPSSLADRPSPEELAFQEELLQRIDISSQLKLQQPLGNQMPGIVLAAAGPSQLATEAPWGGFSAGLFTYALTQHLWQATPPTTVQISLGRAATVVEQLVGKEQQPQLSGQKSKEQSLLAYNLKPAPLNGADGVVMAVEDSSKTVDLWLAGLPAIVLESYGVNSLLTLTPAFDDAATVVLPPQLQIRSREGLTAKAKIVNIPENYNVQVGQLVQEYIRILPRNINLTVALDARLERIERVDATSAFANVPSVLSVVAAGEQPADYLFGHQQFINQPEESNLSTANHPASDSPGGYGLFSLGRDLIPHTVGEPGEAIKVTVNRLVPKLKTLLATKLWRLTTNEGSSRLGVKATLEIVAPTQQVVMQRETLRATSPDKQNKQSQTNPLETGIPSLAIGSRMQYQLQNNSDQPIYFMLLGVDSAGNAFSIAAPKASALAPNQSETVSETIKSQPKNEVIPSSSTTFEWVVQGPAGLVETHLICSRAPLTQALTALAASRRTKGDIERINDLSNSLDVARSLLQDLHQASAVPVEITGVSSDIYALDINAWATLSFIYQVV